jgi:endonuclease VIII
MPEGDTIHRTARTLAKAIGQRTVTRCTLADDLAGHIVSAVEARGKNLLVRFDDGRTLHTHMMMEGSWHIYRPGEPWRRASFAAVAVVETDVWVAVCFDAPIAELLPAGVEPELVRRLGPDLLDAGADLDEAIARLRTFDELAIGDALLHQHLVAGIGNVFKSEALFRTRTDPFLHVGDLNDGALLALLEEARAMMQQSLALGVRATRRRFGGSRLWVYGRSGKPCFVCATPIRMRRQGEHARSTYFCPCCQNVD